MNKMKARMAQLEYKYGRYALQNLMLYLIGGMAIVFLMDLMIYASTGQSIMFYLSFDRSAILHGEVWRLLTFLFLPPDSSLLFVFFALYFYWMIGNALENTWGAFRFNLFYLCGVIGTICAGLIAGSTGNTYLNLSLFLAFAILYPDFEILLFFIIPIKVKWIAIIDMMLYALGLIFGNWPTRAALLFSLLNLYLFFGPDYVARVRQNIRNWKTQRAYQKANRK